MVVELEQSGLQIDMGDEAMNNLAALMGHRAWSDFFLPMMKRARDVAINDLVNPSYERKGARTDDFLRGRIKVLNELIHLGPGTLADYEAALQSRADLERESEPYQERADLGHFGPLSDYVSDDHS